MPLSSSLIDLQEWVVDDARSVRHAHVVDDHAHVVADNAHPTLLTIDSLDHTSHTVDSLDHTSLTVDSLDHTYPPLDPRSRSRSRHAPTSSISSFHSVSLSSDSHLIDDESYEEVSTPPIIKHQVPPKLPQRPSVPPPPRRSSTSTTPHLKVKRPTPVPPPARARYDTVFNANVVQQRRAQTHKAEPNPALLSPEQARGTLRRAAGWRGLSVDLITVGAPDDSDLVGPTEKLEGCFVKPIWRRSRLGRKTLAEIWNECDPDGTGSLTRDQFARGMWRIDEELRRAQVQALKPTSTGSLGSLRTNGRPPAPKIRPILR